MANTFSVTASLSVFRALQALTNVQTGNHYLYYGDHRPSTNTQASPVTEAKDDVYYGAWQQMIAAKKITKSSLAIENIPYTFGTAYDRYDDQIDLSQRDWYAIVNAGSYSHVYVCLDNNNGANSTIQPDFATASVAQNFTYEASDGYTWMYIASTDSATVANLATSNSFPLIPNTAVINAAVDGSIQVIAVDAGGKRYDNYSSGTFQSSDIKVDAISTMYQLSNSMIRSSNGFYTGCVMMITSGTGVGQYATISNFFTTANGNYANLDGIFAITPTNGSTWEVMPGVILETDNTQTVNVVARALVNSLASNSVSRVEVLNTGAGYQAFTTAKVVANSVVGASPAQVRPIMPPRGGHGFDPYVELGAKTLLIGCSLANSEGGLLPATNTYRQFGLLRDPVFANVQFSLSGSTGLFSQGEQITFMKPLFSAANATTNALSVTVIGDTRCFANGDPILAISAGGDAFLGTVNAVTNSTSLTLTSNTPFTSANLVTLYRPQVSSNALCINPVTGSNVYMSNVSPTAQSGMMVYGSVSRVTGTVTSITRNDVAKDFSTFVQLYKYRITALGGTFAQNEYVLQGGEQALVHSVANGYLYVSNMTAPFTPTGGNLTGNTSGATATVIGTYSPEVEFGSGVVNYVENLTDILTRSANTTESFIVPFSF